MELSPLAREKLAKIGDLSPQEKENLKLYEDLTSLLANYFNDNIDADGLWSSMKQHKERGHESIIEETQLRLIHAISLGGNKMDFQRCYKGILACESLKEPNRYTELELNLNSVESLREEYKEEKIKALNTIKENLKEQVNMAAMQMAKQARKKNMPIDIESSLEASAKASPAWKDFILKHEKAYGQKFSQHISKLQNLL